MIIRHKCISVPPVFCGEFSKIPQKYFINSVADFSKFRGNYTIILYKL